VIPLVLGILILAAVWLGPLVTLAGQSFAAHMSMHVAVVAVAAPLLAARLVQLTPRGLWLPRMLAAPVLASVAEFIAIWGWHLPAAHAFARNTVPGLLLEQASFLLSALWLWSAALARPTAPGDPAGAGVLALLLTSMHMILLGTLLTLAPRSLYHTGAAASAHGLGDLHVGGMIMLLGGGLPYLAGGLFLVWRLLHGASGSVTGPSPAGSVHRRGR
jgi:putative membrane protein